MQCNNKKGFLEEKSFLVMSNRNYIFDFEISKEDMRVIDGLENFGGSGLDPDQVDF